MVSDDPKGRISFPLTDWALVHDACVVSDAERDLARNRLIGTYWKPVFCYLIQKGIPSHEAKDIVQEFFTKWIVDDTFNQANQNRGRFRSFILTCLRNFLANRARAAGARSRRPSEGIVSIEEVATIRGFDFEPVDHETPEMVFNRVWASHLVSRVLQNFEMECLATGKDVHLDILKRSLISPYLDGTPRETVQNLARRWKLTEKQVGARLVTARRVFLRILREELLHSVSTEEELEDEIHTIFRYLSSSN